VEKAGIECAQTFKVFASPLDVDTVPSIKISLSSVMRYPMVISI